MRLIDRLRGEARSSISTVDDYVSYMGHMYPLGLPGVHVRTDDNSQPTVPHNFVGYAQQLFAANGPVFSLVKIRTQVFSSVRFMYQELRDGRPGRLFGGPGLDILNEPTGVDTLQDRLVLQLMTADLAGTCYFFRGASDLVWLRPDWVDVVFAPRADGLGVDRFGYLYWPDGDRTATPQPLALEDVSAFWDMPDPLAPWRGMSWLTPVIREVQADSAARDHKLKFFENGAVPGLAVSVKEAMSEEEFASLYRKLNSRHTGVENAYKTLLIGGGADVTVVGADLQQLDFKATQGHGETRLTMAAGVPAVVLGSSEGMQGSSLNAGNYGQARRRFADGTMHPLWAKAAGSFANIIPAPRASRLWYDARDVPFLREDAKDVAEIQGLQSRAIRQLLDAGYTPDSARDAILADDMSLLEHSGLYSVQLQPAGTTNDEGPTTTEGDDG